MLTRNDAVPASMVCSAVFNAMMYVVNQPSPKTDIRSHSVAVGLTHLFPMSKSASNGIATSCRKSASSTGWNT